MRFLNSQCLLLPLLSLPLTAACQQQPSTLLSCENTDQDYFLNLDTDASGNYIIHGTKMEIDYSVMKQVPKPYKETLKLLGKVTFPAQEGAPPQSPRIVLVSKDKPGNLRLEFASPIEGSDQIQVSLIEDRNSEKFNCIKKEDYSQFEEKSPKFPEVPFSEYVEYTDNQLALSCKASGSDVTTHRIRALNFGFAHSNLQVSELGSERPSLQLDDFKETADSIQYFHSGEGFYYPPIPMNAQLILNKTPKQVKGKNIYGVQLFDGEKNLELQCEERWAMDHIFKPVAEKRRIPSALPPKETLSDLSDRYCPVNDDAREDTYELAREIQGIYQDLIMDNEMINGLGIQSVEADQHPLGKTCYAMNIHVDEENLETLKSQLGESLDGLYIEYEAAGRATIGIGGAE